jgi:hypothetical protein
MAKTVQDIIEHSEADTEVIAVLDGEWVSPPEDHPRVRIIYMNQSVGQRAATNLACKLSEAKYVMKVDAHCAFDQGFDRILLADMQDDWTMVPIMRNLHCFDWVCNKCGERIYQGPTPGTEGSKPCVKCGNFKLEDFTRDVVWIGKQSPQSKSYCFDATPHFQYFKDFNKRPEGKVTPENNMITETMSLQGSCFLMTRDKYWELNICDESFGSWGSQGIEVAVKTWLSGGRVVCNHKTWYAHMFRTQGGDFSFPYPMSGRQQEYAKKTAKEVFFNNQWHLQKYPLSWLVKKFWPVPGWTDEDLAELVNKDKLLNMKVQVVVPQEIIKPKVEVKKETPKETAKIEVVEEFTKKTPLETITEPIGRPRKAMIFYTDNQLQLKIAHKVQDVLKAISKEKGIPIVSASLKPMSHFGDINITFNNLKRSRYAMNRQILAALQASNADIIFMTEHDVIYSRSHFDFEPPDRTKFYYNRNWWKIRIEDGHTLKFDASQVSGCCAYRDILIEDYIERVRMFEEQGIEPRNYEPGCKMLGENPINRSEVWYSEVPIIDIRHSNNLSWNRWRQEQFQNKSTCQGWEEGDGVPGWGITKNRFWEFLKEVK